MKVEIDVDTDEILQNLQAKDVLEIFSIDELLQAHVQITNNKSRYRLESDGLNMGQRINRTDSTVFLSSLAYALDPQIAQSLVCFLKIYKKLEV